jgi:hypothetical protein
MAPESGKRQIAWSQGQILPPDAALALQLIAAEKAAAYFPIVISHDCDLAAPLEKEPHVEILIGRAIARLGAASNAKIARRLDLSLQSQSGPQIVELLAPEKRSVPKTKLREYAPRQDL